MRRQSVLVRNLSNPRLCAYAKGAPEIIRDICLPSSLPRNYNEVMEDYAHHGYRIIACAQRTMPASMTWLRAQKAKREQIEKDLSFMGFVVFENRVKESTPMIIQTLKNAKIRQIMCTGDNILTAISVSRECGIIDSMADIFVPKLENSGDNDVSVLWTHVADQTIVLDPNKLVPTTKRVPPQVTRGVFASPSSPSNYFLAVPGDVFRWIVDNSPKDVILRVKYFTRIIQLYRCFVNVKYSQGCLQMKNRNLWKCYAKTWDIVFLSVEMVLMTVERLNLLTSVYHFQKQRHLLLHRLLQR